MKQTGMVYLVGAGPGDFGLMTLRGAELLAEADVVIHDALVNPELLRLAPKSVEIIFAGKRPPKRAMSQEELNSILIQKAREGRRVVRLKGGDPYIFGRGGEEAENLAAANVPFEVVPGISSATAVPAYAGIPLTHRELSSSFIVLTGHEDPSKEGSLLDLERIADVPGTKVILMGVQRMRPLAEALLSHGANPETPVAMIRWGTTGRQQTLEGTLKTIADLADEHEFTAPAVTVIGEVVRLRGRLNWFERRPLFGQRIVVTRTREQAGSLTRSLSELGADVLEIPAIKTSPPDDKEAVVDALLGLNAYDWLIFTSATGVTTFFEYFFKSFEDLRDIGGVRIAAVGPGTAAKLQALHLKVDVMPAKALASEIPAALTAFESMENRAVLLLRAQRANPELPRALEALGAIVDDVATYKTIPATEEGDEASGRFLESGADWITFTSASTVEQFHARFDLPRILARFPKTKLATIGPETSKSLVTLGLKPSVEAKVHTTEGLIHALVAWA
jgi:uroporphyrinogen III methyltransferase / synthase